jgi:hypothetical protein
MSKRVTSAGGLMQARSSALAALGGAPGGDSPPPAGLSEDARFVLDHFAEGHSKRTWKTQLQDEWTRGMVDYARFYPHAASLLLWLRNAASFGPRGLVRYKPGPVPEGFDARLQAYLDAPGLVRWERTYSLVIPGTTRTLWQAWIKVDGSAPLEVRAGGFPAFPDAFTTRRALKAAQEGRVAVGLQALDAAHRRAPRVPRRAAAPPRLCAYCHERLPDDDEQVLIGPDPEAPGRVVEVHASCHAAKLAAQAAEQEGAPPPESGTRR